MKINKAVFDLLRTLDGDTKGQAETAIAHLEEVSSKLGDLEAVEREAKVITEQLGENKISDLITSHQFVTNNGGADKIAEWKNTGSDADKAEIERLKSENITNQQANDLKTETLQKGLDKSNLFISVVPQLSGINPESINSLWKLEADNFGEINGVTTYKGKILSGEGIEQVKTDHPYFVTSPAGGGGNGNPEGLPIPEAKERKVEFH